MARIIFKNFGCLALIVWALPSLAQTRGEIVWKTGGLGGYPQDQGVSWSSDGSKIYTATGPSTNVWNASTGLYERSLSSKSEVALSRRTDRAIGLNGSFLELRNAATDTVLWQVRYSGIVRNCAVNDSASLAIVNTFKTLLVYTGANGLRRLLLNTPDVVKIDFTEDGSRFVTATDQTIRLYSSAGSLLASWNVPGALSLVQALEISPDGTKVLVARHLDYRVYDSMTGSVVREFPLSEYATDAEFTADGSKLATMDAQGRLKVRNTADWSLDFSQQLPGNKGVLSYSPDESKIAARTANGNLSVRSATDGSLIVELCDQGGLRGPVSSYSGSWPLVTAYTAVSVLDYGFEAIDPLTGQRLSRVRTPGPTLNGGCGLSRDGSVVVSSSQSASDEFVLHETLSGNLLRRDPMGVNSATPMVSPDGQYYGFNAAGMFHIRTMSDGSTVRDCPFVAAAWGPDSQSVIEATNSALSRRKVSDGSTIWTQPVQFFSRGVAVNKNLTSVALATLLTLELYSMETGAPMGVFNVNPGPGVISWRPDDEVIAFFDNNYNVQELELATGSSTLLYAPNDRSRGRFSYSPDSTILVFQSDTGNRFGIKSK